MKFGELKSVAHNIADSFGSGMGFLIRDHTYGLAYDAFASAEAAPEGWIEVDFLTGQVSPEGAATPALAKAAVQYRDALPDLCARHAGDASEFAELRARFGTDPVHGRHFRVTFQAANGKRSEERYLAHARGRVRSRA